MSGPSSSRRTSKVQMAAVIVLIAAAWSGALLMPTPQIHEPLTVAVGMWPGAEPFVLARGAGELSRDGVNFVEINWSSAAMRAVGNRVVDATVLSLDEAVRQMGQGYPLRIVLVTDISRGSDAVLARPNLGEFRELTRPRVGYEPRTAAYLILDRYLRENKMSWKDIEEVPVNPAEVEETFGELSLDLVVLPEPWIQRLRSLNLKRLYDSSRPGGEVVRVLAVHTEAVQAHSGAVQALVDAHLKWMPRLSTLGPELEPILRREGVDRAAFMTIIAQMTIPSRDQNARWLQGDDPWLREKIAKLAEELHLKDATRPERVAEMIDASFVTAVP